MNIPSAAYAFQITGNPITCQAFGQGHINLTLRMTTDAGKEYVLQRINRYVFQHPEKVMHNAQTVTEYLQKKDPNPRHTLRFMQTNQGLCYHIDEDGEFWRMYEFVNGLSLDAPESDTDLYQGALAFGNFQTYLADFPAETLYETIPEFHNTVDRYRLLAESAAADPMGRLQDVTEEMNFLLTHQELACSLQRLRETGELPLRVTHNDTKLNNVLLEETTREYLCVLDLDTVMPGLSLYDFGDAIRFGAASAASEEDKNISLNLHLFEVYTRGYLAAATNLTEKEMELMPLSAVVITIELATRFLKDHLDGDRYFKIHYPGQNLDRARGQIQLAADMIRKLDAMQQIVADIRSSTRI